MNDNPPVPTGPPLSPALAAAIAITAATGIGAAEVSTEELLGDVDPTRVLVVLGTFFYSTLGTLLGEEGRTAMLQHMGLDVAREEP